MAASINETRKVIDTALSSTGYSCKTVSWDDVCRGTVDGSLTCWGSNITDTRLNAKDGTSLFIVRSDNKNEKLGYVNSADIALLVGNCDEPRGRGLRHVTLREFLDSPSKNGAAYTGLHSDTKLSCAERDTKVSIRFQTVFLPVDDSGKVQFATEAYNYGTVSDEDPRNLVCLSTARGLSVQADGAGSKRLFLHKRGGDGELGEYWVEAEASRHQVGGEQRESKEEREEVVAQGKVPSQVIGIKAMGMRFNVLMTIQVPLEQSKPNRGDDPMMVRRSAALAEEDASNSSNVPGPESCAGSAPSVPKRGQNVKKGISRAARVSRGDYSGPYERISIKAPKRNAAEHVTVTCVLYNTVMNGVPTAADCLAAVVDMERLYEACSESGRLADATFDFTKKELTVFDVEKIGDKTSKSQPPVRKSDSVSPAAPKPASKSSSAVKPAKKSSPVLNTANVSSPAQKPTKVSSSAPKPKPKPTNVSSPAPKPKPKPTNVSSPAPKPKTANVSSPAPLVGYAIVRAKIVEIEKKGVIVGKGVVTLKLLTLGALQDADADTKEVLAEKFDSLKTTAAAHKNDEASQIFAELKLLIAGAFGK